MKITINLLPIEVKAAQLKEKKFYRVQAISIFSILVLAFFASATVALGVLQSQEVKKTQDDLKEVESVVSTYQQTESSLIALKDRLAQIEKLQGDPSIQRALYNLINAITPAGVAMQSMSIDSGGKVIVSVIVSSSQVIDTYLDNLTSADKNENKVKIVFVENLVRAKDGSFRMNLTIDTNAKK